MMRFHLRSFTLALLVKNSRCIGIGHIGLYVDSTEIMDSTTRERVVSGTENSAVSRLESVGPSDDNLQNKAHRNPELLLSERGF
jgi:hypothetical protein